MGVTAAPRISVIVPVYRAQEYLADCVNSLLAQTFPDFELLLVDDGSPDECPRLCEAFAQKDSRIRVLHQENQGVSAARNTGIEVARGAFLAFVDADDWVEPAFLQRLYACIGDAQIALCGVADGAPLLPARGAVYPQSDASKTIAICAACLYKLCVQQIVSPRFAVSKRPKV